MFNKQLIFVKRNPKTSGRAAIESFHKNIRRKALDGQSVGTLGQWTTKHTVNMDQTPLPPSTFKDGETYANTGKQSVWVCGGQS